RRTGSERGRADGTGDDLLADTALARDEHLGVGPRHALHLELQFPDYRARTDQLDVAVRSHVISCAPGRFRTRLGEARCLVPRRCKEATRYATRSEIDVTLLSTTLTACNPHGTGPRKTVTNSLKRLRHGD